MASPVASSTHLSSAASEASPLTSRYVFRLFCVEKQTNKQTHKKIHCFSFAFLFVFFLVSHLQDGHAGLSALEFGSAAQASGAAQGLPAGAGLVVRGA